jgi:hypothetical protein
MIVSCAAFSAASRAGVLATAQSASTNAARFGSTTRAARASEAFDFIVCVFSFPYAI